MRIWSPGNWIDYLHHLAFDPNDLHNERLLLPAPVGGGWLAALAPRILCYRAAAEAQALGRRLTILNMWRDRVIQLQLLAAAIVLTLPTALFARKSARLTWALASGFVVLAFVILVVRPDSVELFTFEDPTRPCQSFTLHPLAIAAASVAAPATAAALRTAVRFRYAVAAAIGAALLVLTLGVMLWSCT